MSENSIVILPDGVEIPEEVQSNAEIIGLIQTDGSLKVIKNDYAANLGSFENVSEFFTYVGNIKSGV